MSYETVRAWKSGSLSFKEIQSGSYSSSRGGEGVWGGSVVVVLTDKGRREDCATIPCCIKEPTPNQKLLRRVKLFSTTSDPGLQGWASYHS